MKLTGNKLNQN